MRFSVEARDADNQLVTWEIESTSLNTLRRLQVPLEILAVGHNVKFAGWPSKRAGNRIYATNLLAPDGQEVVLWRYSTPRWASTALGIGSEESAQFFRGGVASDTDTLFRVWSTDLSDRDSYVAALTAPLSLTEAAAEGCCRIRSGQRHGDAGMHAEGHADRHAPTATDGTDRQRDTILLRTGSTTSVRTIHMSQRGNPEAQPKTLLGYSTGRWEGKTLVVETSRVSATYLNARGVPLGPSARFVERFTLAGDGGRLDYAFTIIDPDSLTAPAELKRWWVWRPGEQVLPFNCGERVAPGQ